MERSRMILLCSLGALTAAAISTITWMASAGDDGASASIGTEPSMSAATTDWTPIPDPKPIRLDPITDAPRSRPKPPMAAAAAPPQPTKPEPTGAMKRGSLEIEVVGLQDIHNGAIHSGATPGPITALLCLPSGPGSGDFAKLEMKGMFQGERVTFEDVPLGFEYGLSIRYGPKEEQGDMDLRVGGPASSASSGRITVDLGAKRKAEKEVIATLRSLAAAQQQLQASAAIDTDADGGGEHGYLAELAGTAAIRAYAGKGAAPVISSIKLDPTYIPKSFGDLQPAASGAALVRGEYAYQVYLPADDAQRPIRGLAEDPNGGASLLNMPGSSNAEFMWCAYAWPTDRHGAPWSTFFINQNGDVLQTGGRTVQRYSGLNGGPAFDAVFAARGDMGSEPGIAAAGLQSTDGNTWSPVAN